MKSRQRPIQNLFHTYHRMFCLRSPSGGLVKLKSEITPREIQFENRIGTVRESNESDIDLVQVHESRGGTLIESRMRYLQSLSNVSSTLPETCTNIENLSLRQLHSVRIIRDGTLIDVESYKSFKQRAYNNPEEVCESFSISSTFISPGSDEEASHFSGHESKELYYGAIDEIWRANFPFCDDADISNERSITVARIHWEYG